jgi:ABC-type enterobactin transport system permease subunit
MRLDAIDWQTITRPWAKRMIGAASLNEKRKAALWEAGAIEEAEWWNAYLILENLQVFTITGERPSCP